MSDIRTIAQMDRLKNSVNGNPRYRIRFTDGTSGLTKVDAGFVYSLGESYVGKAVSVSWEQHGSALGDVITDITLAFEATRAGDIPNDFGYAPTQEV